MGTDKLETDIDQEVQELRKRLGDNLYSCCLYGSAVRGNLIPGVSDINLLILLKESTPAAHLAIAEAIGGKKQIDPFILGRGGLARTIRQVGRLARVRRLPWSLNLRQGRLEHAVRFLIVQAKYNA